MHRNQLLFNYSGWLFPLRLRIESIKCPLGRPYLDPCIESLYDEESHYGVDEVFDVRLQLSYLQPQAKTVIPTFSALWSKPAISLR